MKKILAALAVLAAMTMAFVSCGLKDGTGIPENFKMTVKEDGTGTVKNGYSTTPTVDKDGVVTIAATAYSQCAIDFPIAGLKEIEVCFKNTGKTTVGFLKAGDKQWSSRIAGADKYYDDPNDDFITEKLTVPAGAGAITFGSNGEDGTITVKYIKPLN